MEGHHQLALNRPSNVQVAMINSQAILQAKGRVCGYFNEGSCSYEFHHGI